MATYNKSGVVRYYVTTDTHHTPWGYRNGVNGKTIHFDLGDNTLGCNPGELDDPEIMSATCMALRGNHDTSVWGWNQNSVDENGNYRLQMQTYLDSTHKIAFFGLDVGMTTAGAIEIPLRQIDDLAEALAELDEGWDVVVLTHAPLFPKNLNEVELTEDSEPWACGECWTRPTDSFDSNGILNPVAGTYAAEADKVVDLLNKFRAHRSGDAYTYTTLNGTKLSFTSNNGRVIGCFAGHIHNHVKCIYKGIAMEAFPTNGSDEWDKDKVGGYANMGLYDPALSYININFNASTVNGQSFTEEADYNKMMKVGEYHHDKDDCYYIDKAACYFKMQPNTTAHPKFYAGAYIGYSYSPLDGTDFGKNGRADRYWPFSATVTLTLGSNNVSARVIWFDANGRLRYYSNRTDFNNNVSGQKYSDRAMYTEIPDYRSVRVTFKANNVQWTFQDGLLVSSVPVYKSGSFIGKNGYGITFGSNGVPKGITLNGGDPKDYGTGENYINVTSIQIYSGTDLKELTATPQIGITGTFSALSKIDLARSTSSGANQISSADNVLMRVVGNNNAVIWIYNGKLTALTDQQVL